MRTSAKAARCPICEAAVDGSSKALPFCSERCRTVDLGNWLGEAYRIPVEGETPADDAPGPDGDGDGD